MLVCFALAETCSDEFLLTITLSLSFLLREFHREQLSIENSMRDLDSAVGRLDNILMSVYVIVAALIIAVTLVGVHSFAPASSGLTACSF